MSDAYHDSGQHRVLRVVTARDGLPSGGQRLVQLENSLRDRLRQRGHGRRLQVKETKKKKRKDRRAGSKAGMAGEGGRRGNPMLGPIMASFIGILMLQFNLHRCSDQQLAAAALLLLSL